MKTFPRYTKADLKAMASQANALEINKGTLFSLLNNMTYKDVMIFAKSMSLSFSIMSRKADIVENIMAKLYPWPIAAN